VTSNKNYGLLYIEYKIDTYSTFKVDKHIVKNLGLVFILFFGVMQGATTVALSFFSNRYLLNFQS
jgi:hypothetical protein